MLIERRLPPSPLFLPPLFVAGQGIGANGGGNRGECILFFSPSSPFFSRWAEPPRRSVSSSAAKGAGSVRRKGPFLFFFFSYHFSP